MMAISDAAKQKLAKGKRGGNPFDDIKTEGAGESRHRHTSGQSEAVQQGTAADVQADAPERNRGGRPRSEIQRQKTVLYLTPENVVAMKTRAVERGVRFSDVIDALIQYHLDDLTDEQLLAVKNANKSKTS